MAFTAFRGMGSVSQFFMALFVILVSVLVTMIVATLVAMPFFGVDNLLGALTGADITNPEHIRVLKYLQTVQSIGMFVLPPLVVGWLFEGNFRTYLSMNTPVNRNMAGMAVLALLLIAPFISFVGFLNQEMNLPSWLSGVEDWMHLMEDQAQTVIEKFMDVHTTGGLLFNLFMIAVIPALGEEFLFRGVIQQIFTRMARSYHWGIWISAFLFSAMHLQFFGFVPRVLLGALFGYFLVYSGSIWVPVLAHFINNTVGVLTLYYGQDGKSELEKIIDPDFSKGFVSYIPVALISLIFAVTIVMQMKRQSVYLNKMRGLE